MDFLLRAFARFGQDLVRFIHSMLPTQSLDRWTKQQLNVASDGWRRSS
jgi:hypothetical protein